MTLQLCVLNYFLNVSMNLLVTCFSWVVIKSIDLKWVGNLNFYHRVLRGDKDTYENSVNSVDRIVRTEIIDLVGSVHIILCKNFGPHFIQTRNSQTPNRLNQNDRIDRTPTPSHGWNHIWFWEYSNPQHTKLLLENYSLRPQKSIVMGFRATSLAVFVENRCNICFPKLFLYKLYSNIYLAI
jgi:hypothetical protein